MLSARDKTVVFPNPVVSVVFSSSSNSGNSNACFITSLKSKSSMCGVFGNCSIPVVYIRLAYSSAGINPQFVVTIIGMLYLLKISF